MKLKKIMPEQGKVYKLKSGSEFFCLRVHNGIPILRNTQSGWTMEVHNVWQYEDGRILWDYSTGGHFEG